LKSGDGVRELPLPDHRLPLGGLSTGRYRRLTIPLRNGDLLLGYSDGVVEARSPEGEFFGSDRLLRVVDESSSDPDEVVRRVLDAVDAFTGDSEPYDDLTLVALARQPEAA
jgi:phosphoserine phosphatase RsbU/P